MFDSANFILMVAAQVPQEKVQDDNAFLLWIRHDLLPILWEIRREESDSPYLLAGLNYKYPVGELKKKYFGAPADAFPSANVLFEITFSERMTSHSLRPGDGPPQWLRHVFRAFEPLGIEVVAFGKLVVTMGH